MIVSQSYHYTRIGSKIIYNDVDHGAFVVNCFEIVISYYVLPKVNVVRLQYFITLILNIINNYSVFRFLKLKYFTQGFIRNNNVRLYFLFT